MNDIYNRIYDETEKSILQITIQKLTFVPCISLYQMSRIALERELGKDECDDMRGDFDKNGNKIFQNEIDKAYKRFNNILSCFAMVEDTDNTSPTRKDKIYDAILKEKQLSIYDTIAQRAGFPNAEKAGQPLFDRMLSFSVINDICNLDKNACPNINSKRRKCENCSNCKNCNNRNKCIKCEKCQERNNCEKCYISTLTYNNIDEDWLARYAPYYYHGQRDGVCFIEYIIFQAIYSTNWHRDLVKLSKIIHSPTNYTTIKAWLDPVIKKIDSTEMYKSCVDTFFEIFYDYVSNKYEKLADEYIRTLLLPEEYSKMKDSFSAVEKYGDNQLQRIIDSNNWYDINRAFKIWNDTDKVQYLAFQIMPHVWKTLIDECEKYNLGKRKTVFAYEDADEIEKNYVAFYCRLIKAFIHESTRDAKVILRECIKNNSRSQISNI